eukprot:Gregarina_sp_Poly_1__11200@NODE_918_length_5717_cov_156_805310_g653_i0_p1_GENE_NODE_918_length_5717_cov_156_805310_g653_i0NODE_918_length_5717_cov_156_805310_g653_i0_p1_ORF_typecomplete_len304_score47_67YEATS/PF03366_16/8_2e29_NODE_918_length_5717_cov_156_805310_g653_i012602171
MESAGVIFVSFIFGSYAFMFTENDLIQRRTIGDESTHEWTCMIRARNPETCDLSTFIKKVVFHLHPSFPNQQRTVETPPYEISETGWGEFELSAKIFFLDPDERPIECRHYLKLYPENVTDIRTISPPSTFRGSCVASETADELIFRSPSARLRELLLASNRPSPLHPLAAHFLRPSRAEEDTYIALAKIVQCQMYQMQENVKLEIQKKAQEIQTLMDIYFTLQPNKALTLLLDNPEVIRSLAQPPGSLNDEKLAEIRAAVKAIQHNKSTGREKPRDVVKIFSDLIQEKVISWNGCISSIDFS